MDDDVDDEGSDNDDKDMLGLLILVSVLCWLLVLESNRSFFNFFSPLIAVVLGDDPVVDEVVAVTIILDGLQEIVVGEVVVVVAAVEVVVFLLLLFLS